MSSLLPPGWTWIEVDDLATSSDDITDGPFGTNLKTEHYTAFGPRVIRLQNIGDGVFVEDDAHIARDHFERLRKHEAKAGDVLVAMLGANLPRACLVPPALGPAIVKADCVRLRPNPLLVHPSYVAAGLNSAPVRQQAERLIHGVGRPRLGLKWLRILRFPLAPLSEQGRIVDAIDSYLSRLDAAVATLERVQARLKAYRAAVLKAAVEGRLVPTEADLARAEKRDYESADVLLKCILAERRMRWEEAELARLNSAGNTPKDERWKSKYQEPHAPDTADLPRLPEGWCWVTWAQIGRSQNGRAFPSREYQTEGIRLLRPGNLHDSGRVVWHEDNTKYMAAEWADRYPDHIVEGRELVVNLTAQSLKDDFLGRTCLTAFGEQCLLNQRIARLTPAQVSERYLLWLFKSPWFRRFVASLNTGSLIQHMFTSQLEELAIPLPPAAEQDRIADEVERLLAVGETLAASVAENATRAGKLRQAILKAAFKGKLVNQDPTDEPAHELLERIRADRAASAPTTKSRRSMARAGS